MPFLHENDILSKEYHHEKNSAFDFKTLCLKSSKKVWWKCSKGHEYETTISNKSKNSNCPVCIGRKISNNSNLLVSFPTIAAELHPKNNVSAESLNPGSAKKMWWKCSKNPLHEWETSISTRCRKGTGCPHCTGKTTFGGNTLYDKYPDIAKEWHPTKNKNKTPSDVCPSAEQKVWWLCSKHSNHEWEAKIANRTKLNRPSGCPYCAGKQPSEENNLGIHPISSEWHPTKNLPAILSQFTINSGKTVWWKCSQNHEWEASISNRTKIGKESGCPVCSGRKADPTYNLLVKYPDIAKEWHPTKNGTLQPDSVTPGSSKQKIWWKCSKNPKHEWEAKISNRTSNFTGCPKCTMSHMERKVIAYFDRYNIDYECQKKFKDLGNLSYDFYVPAHNILIECDGRQHFEEAADFFHHQKSLHNQKLRDIRKNAYALLNNIPLLRISYKDEDYIHVLLTAFLNRIKNETKNIIVFTTPSLYKL